MLPTLFLATAVLGFQGLPTADSAAVRVEREAWTMGTRFRLVVEAATREDAIRASEAALDEVERMERMLSSWDSTSELSRLNAATVGVPISISDGLETVLSEVAAWSDSTEGSFSPWIGALVDAWDIRGRGRTPTSSEITRALEATGEELIEVRSGRAVRRSARAWIDAGAFGKGAALHAAARRLEELGVVRGLLDLGGQLWTVAPPGASWTVLVAHPDRRSDPVARLQVAGVSVATSGLSERPGHLLDPRTGLTAPDWGSVTVVHQDPLAADVLATALYVMGPREGLRWAEERHVAALFLTADEGPVVASWTAALDPWLVHAPRVPATH